MDNSEQVRQRAREIIKQQHKEFTERVENRVKTFLSAYRVPYNQGMLEALIDMVMEIRREKWWEYKK